MAARFGRIPALVLVLSGPCSTGCGSDTESEPVPTGPDASGAGGSAVRLPCPTLPIPEGELQNRASGPSVFGMATGGDPGWFDAFGGSECGLPGVRICLRDTDTCTESDPAGQFVLGGLPEDEDLEITFTKAGHTSLLRLVHTGGVPINLMLTRLVTLDGGVELFDAAGEALDPTRGSLVGLPIAVGEGIGDVVLPAGVVMTLEPGGPRALYSRGVESPGGLSSDAVDPALQATRFGGWGFFINVPAGDHAVRFERDGRLCDQPLPGFGYGADADGNIRVKVVDGYQTGSIAAFCP